MVRVCLKRRGSYRVCEIVLLWKITKMIEFRFRYDIGFICCSDDQTSSLIKVCWRLKDVKVWLVYGHVVGFVFFFIVRRQIKILLL